MVIGFDGSRAFSSRRTGTENYSYQLLKALAKIDSKNNYIVYLRPLSNLSGLGYLQKQTNFQFKIINWPRLWTQGGLALQTFIDKLDILFVPSHTLPLIRKPGLKTVITIHDLGSEYLPSMHQLKQRLYLSFMQNYQLKTASRLIAVSKSTKDDLIKKMGVNKENITVVYEGYNQHLFEPIKNDVLVNRLRYYEIDYHSYFLFVGTVQPRKNLERLIKAYQIWSSLSGGKTLLKSVKLVIVGGKGWMSEEIYKLPKKLGIEQQVKFLDYIKDEDLPILYAGASALIYPSLYEGFGLPILEAQACGCPVVTSNISSMPEVAGENGAIFVDPYSIDDIVKAMMLIKREDQRAKLVKAGSGNVKRFSWEKCATQTLKVFEGL